MSIVNVALKNTGCFSSGAWFENSYRGCYIDSNLTLITGKDQEDKDEMLLCCARSVFILTM